MQYGGHRHRLQDGEAAGVFCFWPPSQIVQLNGNGYAAGTKFSAESTLPVLPGMIACSACLQTGRGPSPRDRWEQAGSDLFLAERMDSELDSPGIECFPAIQPPSHFTNSPANRPGHAWTGKGGPVLCFQLSDGHTFCNHFPQPKSIWCRCIFQVRNSRRDRLTFSKKKAGTIHSNSLQGIYPRSTSRYCCFLQINSRRCSKQIAILGL
jgi:hypothetical protein